MLPYYVPFIIFAFTSTLRKQILDKYFSIFLFILLNLFIGLRFEIGTDWSNYLRHTINEQDSSFSQIINKFTEPLYALSLWISLKTNLGLMGVNLINSSIFTIGLVSFCRNLKYPYLALLISYPYLIVVVGMSYVNQSAAIGMELIALSFYLKENFKFYIVFLIGASLFHASGLYLLVIPIVDQLLNIKKRKSFYLSICIFGVGFFAINYYLLNLFNSNYKYYFETNYNAPGFLIKGSIFFLFCMIYFLLKNKFKISSLEKRLTNTLALNTFIILCLGLYSIQSASSVVFYRLSLYLLPLQILLSCSITESRLLNIPSKSWKIIFISFNFAILFVWLNFSKHSPYWIPYNNYLFY